MFQQILNWRTGLAFIALGIIAGTVFYSQYLANKIAKEERVKVEQWVEASKALLDPNIKDTRLPSKIVFDNKDIPIIETNENDSITYFVNLDSALALNKKGYLQQKLADYKSISNNPITYVDPFDSTKVNRYYYGHTLLLSEIRYYPLIQLFIAGIFIVVIVLALRSSYRSVQNQVWAGMAKETAHQLGTPVSSLEGWVEMLREKPDNHAIVHELEKDVNRLRLVSDRFGKIGSIPQLELTNIVQQINNMVDYIKKRAPGKILFSVDAGNVEQVMAKISPPLFDWVIENLLKNALDALEGKGGITVRIDDNSKEVIIDVSDTGKGISAQNISKVFKPGFTTKKRGWGLGLSLSGRIINQYHQGQIFVKESEVGKGTTFRVILKK